MLFKARFLVGVGGWDWPPTRRCCRPLELRAHIDIFASGVYLGAVLLRSRLRALVSPARKDRNGWLKVHLHPCISATSPFVSRELLFFVPVHLVRRGVVA